MALTHEDGYDMTLPPLFCDYPYDHWAIRFKTFIASFNLNSWGAIEYEYIVPSKVKSKWNKSDIKKFAMNKQLLDIMLKSFDSSISNELVSFDSAYNLWIYIEAHHEILKEMKPQETNERESSKAMDASSSFMDNSSTSCVRPLGDSPSEVSLESEDEDSNIPYDELASAFDKLTRAYDILQSDHEILVSKLDVISNKKAIIL